MTTTSNQRLFQITIATITWLMLLLQFYLQIANRTTSITEAIIRYFSYFTILTNLLVAISFTSLLLPGSRWHSFFSRYTVLTAVTLYILIVGLVYNLVLRSQWNPQGLQLVADNGLHTITPILTLFYWFTYVSAKNIKWAQTVPWLIYPFAYLIYALIRGSFSHFYPYFFINVDNLGYSKALLNAGFVTAAFLVVALLLLGAGKIKRV
ncbi:Pr6Pr family membrane protein [Lacibacter sp. MH-610]|uniref:Pr6Pr family membrane protein n=1 Tax=Lacibacter sp. MH-610 TaxID=3020883 RepID=UPI0038921372